MELNPKDLDKQSAYHLLISSVVPRPIAWVSTISKKGVRNLAPFSFFSGVCAQPMLVSIAVGLRQGKKKDTIKNLEDTGECVIHVVTNPAAESMNESSGDYPADVDEWEVSGVGAEDSVVVKPPRIKGATVAMEGKLYKMLEWKAAPMNLALIEIVHVHIDDRVWDGKSIVVEKLDPIGRLGEDKYARIREIFRLPRPEV
ncbi:MAG: flavin reductase family protein [Candidatus Omnitrophica bacterium]|nr:flavin reductase family protein [Candidatus Omnitrophota bacterium]